MPVSPFVIRKATIIDAFDIAKINVDSWKSTYKNIVHASFLESLNYEKLLPVAQRRVESTENDCFVAVDTFSQNVIGFVNVGKCREKNIDADCEIYAIYVYEEFQGRGAGRLLFDTSVVTLKQKKYKKMMVSVFEKNVSSRKFYEKMGGKITKPDCVILENISYPTSTYVWEF